jgi:class 3 adenylate cyclase
VTVCASCGAENPAGQRFCGSCGTALAAVCATCGATNPAGQRFCGDCGLPLGEEPAPASAAALPAEVPEPVTERRVVSVLFADLVGFTNLSETRDAEEVRELLSRYFDSCRRLIELYGGTVEKFIGLLAEARETFERLGAHPCLDRIDAVAVAVPDEIPA